VEFRTEQRVGEETWGCKQSMTVEQSWLEQSRPDVRPPNIGLTILASPSRRRASALLAQVISLWRHAAELGRYSDEELGDWPDLESCKRRFPQPFVDVAFTSDAEFDVWTDDLHERDWVWWSGSVVGAAAKIDINSESMPITLWPLTHVIETAGGSILYQDMWISTSDCEIVFDLHRKGAVCIRCTDVKDRRE